MGTSMAIIVFSIHDCPDFITTNLSLYSSYGTPQIRRYLLRGAKTTFCQFNKKFPRILLWSAAFTAVNFRFEKPIL